MPALAVEQLMPGGLVVTRPAPLPITETKRVVNVGIDKTARASTRPKPKVVSNPGVPRSTVLSLKMWITWLEVRVGLKDYNRAAIAAI